MLIAYLPILLFIIAALLVAASMVLLSTLAGPRRAVPAKFEPYECGMAPVGLARERFSVKFYLVAMLFIIFDIEIIFLFPWGVIFKELGWFGFFEMGCFILVLVLGLAYVWRKGGLNWDEPERRVVGRVPERPYAEQSAGHR